MSTPVVGSPRLEYGTDTSPVPAPRVSWITTSAPDGWLQSGAELRLATTDGEQTATVDGGASVQNTNRWGGGAGLWDTAPVDAAIIEAFRAE